MGWPPCGSAMASATHASADLLNRVRQPFNVNSLAQAAAPAALGDQEHVRASVELNRAGMRQLTSGLRAAWGSAISPRSATSSPSTWAARRRPINEALLRRGLHRPPVANYGLPNHLRVTIGLEAENARFIAALTDVLALTAMIERLADHRGRPHRRLPGPRPARGRARWARWSAAGAPCPIWSGRWSWASSTASTRTRPPRSRGPTGLHRRAPGGHARRLRGHPRPSGARTPSSPTGAASRAAWWRMPWPVFGRMPPASGPRPPHRRHRAQRGRRLLRRPLPQPPGHPHPACRRPTRRRSRGWSGCGGPAGPRSAGCRVAHHDEVLAATSHLPHMLAYGLVDALARMDETDEIFRYAAGGFRDFTRIASSHPGHVAGHLHRQPRGPVAPCSPASASS